jgi:hypothetical protein
VLAVVAMVAAMAMMHLRRPSADLDRDTQHITCGARSQQHSVCSSIQRTAHEIREVSCPMSVSGSSNALSGLSAICYMELCICIYGVYRTYPPLCALRLAIWPYRQHAAHTEGPEDRGGDVPVVCVCGTQYPFGHQPAPAHQPPSPSSQGHPSWQGVCVERDIPHTALGAGDGGGGRERAHMQRLPKFCRVCLPHKNTKRN